MHAPTGHCQGIVTTYPSSQLTLVSARCLAYALAGAATRSPHWVRS
jgi:hypothetical protein